MPDFNGFSLGVSAKLIQSKILATAQTAAVDVGLFDAGLLNGRFRGSLTVTNLGGWMDSRETAEALSAAARLGSALVLTPAWLLSADAVFPAATAPMGRFGTEYAMAASGPWKPAGRAGYSSQTAAGISGLTGVSLGFGVGRGKNVLRLRLRPVRRLWQAHRLSFTYNLALRRRPSGLLAEDLDACDGVVLLDLVHDVLAGGHPPEDRVDAVQMGRGAVGDVELGPVGAGAAQQFSGRMMPRRRPAWAMEREPLALVARPDLAFRSCSPGRPCRPGLCRSC